MKFTVFDFDKRFPRGVLRMNETLGSRQRFLKNHPVTFDHEIFTVRLRNKTSLLNQKF